MASRDLYKNSGVEFVFSGRKEILDRIALVFNSGQG